MWILTCFCYVTESNDDDWEQEFDLEDTEVDTLTEQQLTETGKA